MATTTIATRPPATAGAYGLVKQMRGQAAITGTGSLVFTGLSTVIAGTEGVTVANSGATTPWSIAMETGLSGVTLSAVVLAPTGVPAIAVSAVAQNVNFDVWGY